MYRSRLWHNIYSINISSFLSTKNNLSSLSSDIGEGGGNVTQWLQEMCSSNSYTKVMFELELKHIKSLIEVTSWSSRTYHGGGNSPKNT